MTNLRLKNFSVFCVTLSAFVLAAPPCQANETLTVPVGGENLVQYQSRPMSTPKGGEKFKGSNFIHPLKTPSGFVVSDLQPGDHLHHFGLWWPWKYVKTEGRKVLCWELQRGDGIIQAQDSETTANGFTANSIYVDRKAPGGPKTLLKETANVTVSGILETPARGYSLTLEIIHEVAGRLPLTISKYRYSGFCLRGTPAWNKDNSTVLTSEGLDYSKSNFTRAKWVRIEGATSDSATAGVLMMSHPDNHAHPEKLRTWDPKTHHGAIFVNFNPVQDASTLIQPGTPYTRQFELFIYDGTLTAAQADAMWQAYAGSE